MISSPIYSSLNNSRSFQVNMPLKIKKERVYTLTIRKVTANSHIQQFHQVIEESLTDNARTWTARSVSPTIQAR